MKKQHTPGQWVTGEVFNKEGKAVFFIDKSKGGEHKRRLDNAGLYSDDDASLIAAAPELLAALENARNVLAAMATGDLHAIDRNSPALAQARAAIAKAKGE